MNIDPAQIEFERLDNSFSVNGDDEETEKFNQRLSMAINAVENLILPRTQSSYYYANSPIALCDFSGWSRSLPKPFDMPPEMLQFKAPPMPGLDGVETEENENEQFTESDNSTPPRKSVAPLSKQQILNHEWPTDANLDRLLTDVPEWLKSAIVQRGAVGKVSHLWNPALLAVCLCSHARARANKSALTRFIKSDFPDWFDEWEEKSELL